MYIRQAFITDWVGKLPWSDYRYFTQKHLDIKIMQAQSQHIHAHDRVYLFSVIRYFLFRCEQEKCTLRIHSNAALGWHAVAITLEDFPASTTNFHTATPFSHVSLQFLVHVSSSSGPCNRAPLLIGQSPNDGSCEEVPEGGTFYSIIEAKHVDSSRRYKSSYEQNECNIR